MRTSYSLKTRFIATFVVLVVISCLVLSLAIGRQASEQAESRIGVQLTDQARYLSRTLDRSMWFWSQEIQLLRAVLSQDNDHSPARITAMLNSLKQTMPTFSWIGLTDTEGTVLAATDNLLVGNNISQRPVFQEGIKGLFIGDVHDAVLLSKHLPNPDGEPMKFVDVSMRVRNASGQITGVLAAHLSWTWAKNIRQFILQDAAVSSDTELFVVARDGTILLGNEHFIGNSLSLPMLEDKQSTVPYWDIQVWPDGRAYLTAVAHGTGFREYSGLGWSVVARQPLGTAYAPVHAIIVRIVLSCLVLSFVFAGAAWKVAEKIIEPLKSLTNAAYSMSRGEPASMPHNTSIREIDVLSQALDTLVDNLTKSEDDKNRFESTATRDQLTGMLNRHGLEARLPSILSRLRENHGHADILYMDLDGFKPVNDGHGHRIGDLVLIEVARRMAASLRASDMLVRIGGDEFVAVLENSVTGSLDMAQLGQRIISTVGEPIHVEGQTLCVGLSMGHSRWQPDEQRFEDALEQADKALYTAKKCGKDRMEFSHACNNEAHRP
ncbi:sensor domain-containing diguanylate cyclase [Desulfovibrio intestinalis]|uniref:Diguanylate cyclase (GGDEF)-like protein n=1 Tax=Desulfovibrio intestinalis TaxID=58621 RepID=A0A7W8C0Z0_9BACT|nr:sensor domain-containing diguanylate cyclase [Desulfovibrio intestinalis]MBB5143617.1 diguanylate cyclase (GGDEF)-like protein [Desulfovibrio intestinalis]